MYHYSGNAVQQAAGSATGVLDRAKTDGDTILFQRCTWCGTAMYHRLLCPVCQGSDLRTERSEGTGTVRHATVVNRNTPAARNVSLVEMAEGFVALPEHPSQDELQHTAGQMANSSQRFSVLLVGE
ncbi:zinc ribbon domain-containing protein, partial [Streptomyces sp. NPDC005486]|uniref:Zn-ribbon domain-containing OB-fold protein n=1 Tax=Streptomyces sp. NPDC005486 TaxID=3155345 RepID=UPI0033BB82CA